MTAAEVGANEVDGAEVALDEVDAAEAGFAEADAVSSGPLDGLVGIGSGVGSAGAND